MKKLLAFLLCLIMILSLTACGGENLPATGTDTKQTSNGSQTSGVEKENGWFTDKVLAQMKLSDFSQPEGFELLTNDELPDAMENNPYVRVLKGANDHDEYKPVIEKVFGMLKQSYGEIYEQKMNVGADGMVATNYVPMPEIIYGDAFYVKDGDIVRSVNCTMSSFDNVDSKVLKIAFTPIVED